MRLSWETEAFFYFSVCALIHLSQSLDQALGCLFNIRLYNRPYFLQKMRFLREFQLVFYVPFDYVLYFIISLWFVEPNLNNKGNFLENNWKCLTRRAI